MLLTSVRSQFVMIALMWVLTADTISAQSVNCSANVIVDGYQLLVTPNGYNDTDNIECALNEAGRLGIETVSLSEGDFKIENLSVSDIRGTFKGV